MKNRYNIKTWKYTPTIKNISRIAQRILQKNKTHKTNMSTTSEHSNASSNDNNVEMRPHTDNKNIISLDEDIRYYDNKNTHHNKILTIQQQQEYDGNNDREDLSSVSVVNESKLHREQQQEEQEDDSPPRLMQPIRASTNNTELYVRSLRILDEIELNNSKRISFTSDSESQQESETSGKTQLGQEYRTPDSQNPTNDHWPETKTDSLRELGAMRANQIIIKNFHRKRELKLLHQIMGRGAGKRQQRNRNPAKKKTESRQPEHDSSEPSSGDDHTKMTTHLNDIIHSPAVMALPLKSDSKSKADKDYKRIEQQGKVLQSQKKQG